MNDPLDPIRIDRLLAASGAALGRPLTCSVETVSTNDDARAAARGGAPHGATFVADAQTAGRGQGDHGWYSPAGRNLYLSVIMRPPLGLDASACAPLTLAAGVALLEAIRPALPDASIAQLKWPNDLWLRGKKAAGILVEATQRGARVDHLVVGIGLNVHERTFPVELSSTATSLALEGATALDRSSLVASVLTRLDRAYARFARDRLASFLERWRAADALVGRRIRVRFADGSARAGVGAGVDLAGRLLLDTDGGALAISSGRVELEQAV
jgi:BirA family transcriptional regulator, biotin operon repressor / biotin---[acetyl-CoA-carboxylase] ligase